MKALKLIKSQKNFLNRLNSKTTSKEQAQWLLDNSSSAQVKALSEICMNVMRGNIELTPDVRSKLVKHKNCLRLLASVHVKEYTINKKRECLKNVHLITTMVRAAMPTLEDIYQS